MAKGFADRSSSTSGGLLVACASDQADEVTRNIVAEGYPSARVIGRVESGPPKIWKSRYDGVSDARRFAAIGRARPQNDRVIRCVPSSLLDRQPAMLVRVGTHKQSVRA